MYSTPIRVRRQVQVLNEVHHVSYICKNFDFIKITKEFLKVHANISGTYKYPNSSCILFDPKVSTDEQRERIAIIIAHELAHMWFGNLVTVEWWTHLWLKEGFASYLQYLSIDNVSSKLNNHVPTEILKLLC